MYKSGEFFRRGVDSSVTTPKKDQVENKAEKKIGKLLELLKPIIEKATKENWSLDRYDKSLQIYISHPSNAVRKKCNLKIPLAVQKKDNFTPLNFEEEIEDLGIADVYNNVEGLLIILDRLVTKQVKLNFWERMVMSYREMNQAMWKSDPMLAHQPKQIEEFPYKWHRKYIVFTPGDSHSAQWSSTIKSDLVDYHTYGANPQIKTDEPKYAALRKHRSLKECSQVLQEEIDAFNTRIEDQQKQVSKVVFDSSNKMYVS